MKNTLHLGNSPSSIDPSHPYLKHPTSQSFHDWHTDGPWNQEQIRLGLKDNSFWAVEVAREGEYEISLRRWPKELDAPITAAADNGQAISASLARLKIGQFEQIKKIHAGARAIKFNVHLKACKTRLQSWFIDDKSRSLGAYYVYVKRLD